MNNAPRDPASTRWGTAAAGDPRAEREIDEHLELVPFIDLGVSFDHAACLAEAKALVDRFVPYQSDPRYGITHWRGLGLRALGGDPTRVAVANITPNDRYETTPIAAECPATMALLRELLDWDRAHSVAFLALRPGTRIAPHLDDPQYEVMRSINIALNMPEGCEFMIDTEPNGAAGPFTRAVPFRPGSVMMVNVARYHYVENRSAEVRIHVVARGPLRWSPATLRDRARAQNGIADEAALRAALDQRYARLGRPSDHDPEPTRYQPKRRIEVARPDPHPFQGLTQRRRNAHIARGANVLEHSRVPPGGRHGLRWRPTFWGTVACRACAPGSRTPTRCASVRARWMINAVRRRGWA